MFTDKEVVERHDGLTNLAGQRFTGSTRIDQAGLALPPNLWAALRRRPKRNDVIVALSDYLTDQPSKLLA